MKDDFVPGEACQQHGCHACCLETEMPLTVKDVMRISGITGLPVESFTSIRGGMTVLKNTRENDRCQCFFLDTNSHCSIYRIRPQGCRYYPVIWDLDNRIAVLHEYCPYREDFKTQVQQVSERVRKLVLKLLKEAK
ncbi:MAG: YkgJ family cysteine cluster protein [Candidatus Odinarchaeota archaeon]